jgi:thiamine-phosphate pyrophosphorylase
MGVARQLNRAAGCPALPPLLFLTDPQRTPDPCAAAARLPRGAAIVFRHFGSPDRLRVARQLTEICRRRRLVLLIGADPLLARQVRADGIHWPERSLVRRLPARPPAWIVTAAAHTRRALARARAARVHAILLSPVFPSRSASAATPLGPLRAGRLAKLANCPVYALGGVNAHTAKRLIGLGFAGVAAIEGLG